jgi:cobalt-zinc-cadmium efflux system outer membrane protein
MQKYFLIALALLAIAAGALAAPPQRLPSVERTARLPQAALDHRTERVTYQAEPPEPLPAAQPAVEPARGLTLADLEQMALAGNPSIARAAALVSAARGNWVQVGLPPNPISGYEGQQIGSAGLAEQDGAFVEQEIVRGGKLRLNREVAAQQIVRLEHELAAQQQRVLNDVAIAYYNVLIAERQQQLAAALLDIAQKNLDTAESLLRAKQVGRIDVNQASLEYENATILAQNARNRRNAAWQSLGAILGQPQLPPQLVIGNPEDDHEAISFEAARDRLLSSSPEVSASLANLQRARWALERARVEYVPNVTVQGLVNWRDNGVGGRSDGALMVGLPIPAWNRNQGGIMQAQCEVVAAERGLAQLELDLQNRLAPVYERYANAQNQVQRYRTRILPAARDTLDLTRKLYEGSEIDYVTLLTAQRTYSQTNLNYLDALRELRASEIELQGMLLRGSLEAR